MDENYYSEYYKELQKQKALMLSELAKQQSEDTKGIQSILSGGNVYYGGQLKKALSDINSSIEEKRASGLSAIAMETAKVSAIEKAQNEAKRIGKTKSWITTGATALGAGIGTIVAPGAGTLMGAQLGASLGGLGSNVYGATQGDLSSMENIPSDIVGTIGMMDKDPLLELMKKYYSGMGNDLTTQPKSVMQYSNETSGMPRPNYGAWGRPQ